METEITQLTLVASLWYAAAENPDPFGRGESTGQNPGGETLFCFELDGEEALRFEPRKEKLLGNLVFGGTAVSAAGEREGFCELPGGNYLFAQKREELGREEIIALALEIQQEGLWRRLLPGKKLYLRRLFEDGGRVTQLFRPYAPPDNGR